jgi:ABC-type lipoprotein export system ATPase subunit
VSLIIDQSELAAIAGPPGPGKTTLLHLMATLGQDRPGRTRNLYLTLEAALRLAILLAAAAERDIGIR